MSESNTIPGWYKIAAILALLWNIIGLYFYYAEVTATQESLAATGAWSQEQIDYMLARPAWSTSAFAIAVLTGIIGSAGLVMKKGWAKPVLLVSLIAVLVSMIDAFVRGGFTLLGGSAIGISATVTILAALIYWFSRKASANGWLS